MKKTLILMIAAQMVIFASCRSDDSSGINLIHGTWNLVRVSCECIPSGFTYGDHVWMFNVNLNNVTVHNFSDNPQQQLETGTYEFDLTDSEIQIETVTYEYYFENDKLFLADHPEIDGPLLEFVRQ